MKFTVLQIASRRERKDFIHPPDQAARLARNRQTAGCAVTVKQRTNSDGITGCNDAPCFPVVAHAGEFRVQPAEQLAVRAALKNITLILKLPLHRPEAVQFAVAHCKAAVKAEGLHPLRGQAHNGKTLKSKKTAVRKSYCF